jgi:hypothetical protein
VEKTVGKLRTIETIHLLMEYLTKDKDDIISSLLVSNTNALLHNLDVLELTSTAAQMDDCTRHLVPKLRTPPYSFIHPCYSVLN